MTESRRYTYESMIPVSRPSIGREESDKVLKVFDSGWLGMGKWVFEFESKLKEFLGERNCIAVNTGTTALHLALDAAGVGRGDQVIVPSLTFVASLQAIMATGAEPCFCDIEEDTLNLDVDDMRKRITRRTKAIMPVHYGGQPCDMDRILDIAKPRKIRVIEDAAHAFGSLYKGRKIGSFGDITCFSFDPIKNITCGEGGAIITRDKTLTGSMYKKRILGIDKDTWSRYRHKRDWFYNVGTLGFRYHMSNISAAIGLTQIEKMHAFIAKKRKIAKTYDERFRKLRNVKLLRRDYENIAPFNYIIKVTPAAGKTSQNRRDRLMAFLKERKIDSGVHYIPNHLQPFFKDFRVPLAKTERVWKEILTLPLYYDMSDRDIRRVTDSVEEFFA